MQNENLTPVAFQFSATKQDVRSLVIENEPWLVAKDICDILDLSHTTKALKVLDDDEKLNVPIVQSGQKRKMLIINESGLYKLIFKSIKPEAKAFQKWVTSEVLPSIRRKGYYHGGKNPTDYVDARVIPYAYAKIHNAQVRCIELENIPYYSINDLHFAIHSNTDSSQTAKKLNAIETLAVKILLFGNTRPAWFTNELGVQLILSGSRVLRANQLKLAL